MKKLLFITLILSLFACVFANAFIYPPDSGFAVGSDGPRTINVSCDSPNIGDIETGETVKVLVTLDSPAENWDLLTEPTLAEISYSGIWSQYVFEIILVAGNTLGNDTFKLVGDGEIELTFNVVAPKKDFTVTANGDEIDPTKPLNLNELSGNGFEMRAYDDQGGLIKTTKYILQNIETVEGNLGVAKQKQLDYVYIWKVSGEGKAKVTLSKDGYKDFVFYVTYTEPKKDSVKIFKGDEDVTGKDLEMNVLDFATFTAKVESETLSNKVTWSTDNWNVLRILSNGYHNAKKPGEATITVASKDDPTVKATVNVKVNPRPFDKLQVYYIDGTGAKTLAEGTITIKEDESIQFFAQNQTGESVNVNWSTSDWNTARVICGVVDGKKIGTVTITATSIYFADKTVSFNIEVAPKFNSEDEFKVFFEDGNEVTEDFTIGIHDPINFYATINGETVPLKISTDNWNVCRAISPFIEGKKLGDPVTITFSSPAYGVEKSVQVTVIDYVNPERIIYSIKPYPGGHTGGHNEREMPRL